MKLTKRTRTFLQALADAGGEMHVLKNPVVLKPQEIQELYRARYLFAGHPPTIKLTLKGLDALCEPEEN